MRSWKRHHKLPRNIFEYMKMDTIEYVTITEINNTIALRIYRADCTKFRGSGYLSSHHGLVGAIPPSPSRSRHHGLVVVSP
jgi:hypothetical protein